MAAKKKLVNIGRAGAQRPARADGVRERLRRTDDEKLQLVRQIMQSGNQSAEIKKLGIYPNQFYDWKKKFGAKLGAAAAIVKGVRGGRAGAAASGSAADEAKAFIHGKASLLERLRAQREELDTLISQLEA
jgi:transposase-like protein